MNKKELIDAFVLECKQEQEWKERFKANHIDFWNYFKYSGKIEKEEFYNVNFLDFCHFLSVSVTATFLRQNPIDISWHPHRVLASIY